MTKYIAFLDCTNIPPASFGDYVRRLKQGGAAIDHIVAFDPLSQMMDVPEGVDILSDMPANEAVVRAFSEAERRGAAVVAMLAPVVLSGGGLQALGASLESDALLGMAMPRYADPATGLVWSLPHKGEEAVARITRRALVALPENWIVPEFLGACLVIRKNLVANAPFPDDYETVAGCLRHLLCAFRRRAFRMVMDNRVVISTELGADQLFPQLGESDAARFEEAMFRDFSYPVVESDDAEHFKKTFPFEDNVFQWYDDHVCHRLEGLTAAAYPPNGKRSLLLDCRNILAHPCGTTVAQLGFLSGFEHFVDEWDIHVLAQDFALEAHDLVNSFPKLTFSEFPFGHHSAMVFLSQPCFSGLLRDLHRHGYVASCNILDTICWDMILGAPVEVERVWSLAAEYMDIIFYNSNFSMNQFDRRFRVQSSVVQLPTHHSFVEAENVDERFVGLKPKDYILVFGNNYDHKDVFPTTKRLREMFPDRPIHSLGPDCCASENVTVLASGTLTDDMVEQLVAEAGVVVFPSWIEGFGLPVVKALAYGRPVVVRELPLWQEIADNCDLKGSMLAFNDGESLRLAVEAAFAGDFDKALKQGAALDDHGPADWRRCAGRILEALEKRLAATSCNHWFKRERVARFLPEG